MYHNVPTRMNRLKALRAHLAPFLEKKANFSVVYYTHGATLASVTQRLCILDSSFNPPHWGHYSLIDRSLKYAYHGKQLSSDSFGVLLMLSVNNCDKKVPQPAAFEYRLDMMCLLADHIKKELNVPVYVILTDQPIFADKSIQVQEWIKSTVGVINDLRLTFLLGFDTLVRVFDNKYYKPVPTTVALKDFMEHNDLFALTRDGDKDYSVEEQLKYVDHIREGKNVECLSEWSEKIFVDQGNDDLLEVSSSQIRSEIASGDESWKKDTLEPIANYIDEHNPY
jgi:nicotinamide-nucleotide adenylyltransferase